MELTMRACKKIERPKWSDDSLVPLRLRRLHCLVSSQVWGPSRLVQRGVPQSGSSDVCAAAVERLYIAREVFPRNGEDGLLDSCAHNVLLKQNSPPSVRHINHPSCVTFWFRSSLKINHFLKRRYKRVNLTPHIVRPARGSADKFGHFPANKVHSVSADPHTTTIDTLPHLISVQTGPHTLVLALRACSVIHLSVYSSTCAWICESRKYSAKAWAFWNAAFLENL